MSLLHFFILAFFIKFCPMKYSCNTVLAICQMRLFWIFNPLLIICLAKQVYKVPKNKNKIEVFSVFSALPRGGPTIKGGRLRYSLGDSVDVNCTSADSKPAADLHWFINGQPVSKNTFLTFWPEREMSCRDRRPKVYLYNLSAFFFFYQKCHVKRLLLWK